MKQRLLTISVNTRYRVIFACLYWKSQGISSGLESGHPAAPVVQVPVQVPVLGMQLEVQVPVLS